LAERVRVIQPFRLRIAAFKESQLQITGQPMRLTVFKVTWHVLSESDSSYSGAGTIRNLGWIEKEEAGIATIELPPRCSA
jgi:hypothetical protein